jgi:uncharacterized OsmC-like protein
MSDSATVTLTRLSGFQFQIDFGAGMPALLSDEPPPLGQASGPAPNHLLLAAVANCLSASLVFALGKFKQDPGALKVTATARTGRNDAKRLRIEHIDVHLELQQPGARFEHLDRVLAQFEEFCTVSMSVRQGIEIGVRVSDVDGAVLKG